MKISRENYEIWFADWLDNKLTAIQQEELEKFIEENPDLQQEFNQLSEMILNPARLSYNNKVNLIRKPSEMSDLQYGLLCAAALEGDLQPDQLSEFTQIRESDPEKKRTAKLIALTRLNPPVINYPDKSKLFRKTFSGTIFQYAVPVLGAAAIIALVIITGVFRNHVTVNPEFTGTIALVPPVKAQPEKTYPAPDNSSATLKNNPVTDPGEKLKKSASQGEKQVSSNDAVTISRLSDSPEMIRVKINPIVNLNSTQAVLVNGPSYGYPVTPEFDDERSRFGKFIARTFREKVLDEKAPSDSRLKGYEIAEAGITGLNKLLGWDMALTKNTDDNGRTNSVYFNSRLLKFNAPVKNNEQGE